MRERRQHKRVAARLQVKFFDSKGNTKLGLCRNVSIGGMGVEADFSLAIGVVVGIEFSLPFKDGFRLIRAKATVVDILYRGSIQKMAIGLSFNPLDSGTMEVIHEFVRDRVAI